MKIYTIIITYNATRNDWISKCLNSLLNSNLKTEIIVVDNNSDDSTIEVIRQNFPEVKLIESKENLGFGKANNLGIKEALKKDYDYVFLLNQDAWIEKETIENLIKIANENPDFGVVSPIHLNGKGTALDYSFSKQISPQFCENLYSDFVLNQVENRIYESGFVCAAAWLVSKKCLKKVGGFSPTFFHYAEDDNYVHRLSFRGLKIGVYPFSKIYHDRQGRENSKFDSQQELSKRRLLLKYSNPNENFSIKKELRILKNKRWKARLLNDQNYINIISSQINFIQGNQNQITENLLKSKSEREYIFLIDE